MKKLIVVLVAGMFLLTPLAFAANYGAVQAPGPTTTPAPGPAPNSGDGISDGSGWDEVMDELSLQEIITGTSYKPGPAPNSGDGVPDGSGFEVPPGRAK